MRTRQRQSAGRRLYEYLSRGYLDCREGTLGRRLPAVDNATGDYARAYWEGVTACQADAWRRRAA